VYTAPSKLVEMTDVCYKQSLVLNVISLLKWSHRW